MASRWRICLLVFALTFGTHLAVAQTGSIAGTVLDSAGGTVPKASVKAFDENKQIVARETTTNTEGGFQLTPLLPGRYTIQVSATGFKEIQSKGLTLDQNQVMNLGALTLQVGQMTESVSVDGTSPLVETSTSQKSFVVTSKQVTEIPLNGRDFQSLMRTLPGVVSNDTSDFRLAFNNTNAFNVNGQRGSSNNVFLDGSINTDLGANDGQYTQVSLDAVGEFKLQTSAFNAEYGRNPGVMISINTKSGGSTYHGTAYEFLRNNAFDARTPFDTTGKIAKLRFNQFGANLGGPVPGLKKKLFFFFNYEGTRATRPLNSNTFIDIASQQILNGNFQQLYRSNADGSPQLIAGGTSPVGTIFQPGSVTRDSSGRAIGGIPYPNNVVPVNTWNRNAPAFIKLMSGTNRAGLSPTPGIPEQVRFPLSPTYAFNKNGKVGRVDYSISPKANFFFRWADDAQNEQQNVGIFTTQPYPVMPQFRKKPGASWSWNLVNVISPTTTNEVIFAYNHLTQIVDVVDGSPTNLYDRTSLGFQVKDLYPDQNIRNRFPQFSCGIGNCNYSTFQNTWKSEGKTYAWTDNLTHQLGSHTIKVGGFFNFNNNGQQPGWGEALNINFGPNASNPNDTNNQFANMLLGNYTSVSQTRGIYYGAFRQYTTELYAQDSWKASRRLTLEFGVRWAYEGPTYTHGKYLMNYFQPDQYDRSQAVKIVTQTGTILNGTIIKGSGNPYNGLVEEGSGGLPLGGVQHRYNNVAPRFGLAWDPFGDGKTAIRMGGGLFFERVQQNVYNFGGLGNPPLVYTPTFYGGNLDDVSPSLVANGTISPVSVVAVDRKGQVPVTYAWSFDLQRELGKQTSIDVGYVGNMGRHQQYNRDLGQLPLNTTTAPGTTILSSVNNTQNAIRPYLGFTNVNYTEFGATSNYNALQTRVTRRFATHLTMNVAFVWSKVMDQVDSDGTAIGYYLDRLRDSARAGFDRTKVFNVDYVYELPDFAKQNGFLKKVVNGWQLAGFTRFWDGTPLNVSANGDPGTLGGGQRAVYLGGQIYPDTPTRFNYFNPQVFGRGAQGTLGGMGRNALTGPGINQWDISMYKNTKITERVQAQLRVETFNTFNHTQWAGVNAGISVPNPSSPVTASSQGSTGQVSSTRDPRNIQFGLKLMF